MKYRLFLLTAIFALTGCTTSHGANTQNVVTSANTKRQYGIGDSVKVGDVVYKVNSASNTKKVGSEHLGDETQNNFVIINLSIKNVGNEEMTLYDDMMELHVGEKTYSSHSSGIYLDDGFYVLETIGADIATTKNVLFETPTEYTSEYYLLVKPASYAYESEKIYLK